MTIPARMAYLWQTDTWTLDSDRSQWVAIMVPTSYSVIGIRPDGSVAAWDCDISAIVRDYRGKRDRLCSGLADCYEMVKPGGLMIAATLNRTLKSFALAIVGAEYILRWLPVGSHRWDKFVTPNELEIAMEQGGLQVIAGQGVIYNILADRWQLSSDADVNYMLVAERSQ